VPIDVPDHENGPAPGIEVEELSGGESLAYLGGHLPPPPPLLLNFQEILAMSCRRYGTFYPIRVGGRCACQLSD